MVAQDTTLARLVAGGKVMGLVAIKEPQARAEAAAMQVSTPLRHLEAENALPDDIERSATNLTSDPSWQGPHF